MLALLVLAPMLSTSVLLFYIIFFNFLAVLHVLQELVPQPGIEPGFPAVKAWSPNRSTTREFPTSVLLEVYLLLF